MNYTEKYHLPQWEEDDRIMRTDFNQMCADMEAAVAGCYSPDKRPNEFKRIPLYYTVDNGVAYAFEREPVMVILYNFGRTMNLHQGHSGFIGNTSDLNKCHLNVKLVGKDLVILNRTENFNGFSCEALILY